MDHVPRCAHKGAQNVRVGGCVMVEMMERMGCRLAGDDPRYDHETGQDPKNETCARRTSHHHRFPWGKRRILTSACQEVTWGFLYLP